MNTATELLPRERPVSPVWPPLRTTYDARLLAFFRDKVRPEDCVDLANKVWTNFLVDARVPLFTVARGVLLDYCKVRGAVSPPWAARERLHVALGRLAMDTRILLELRYYDQMSARELASLYQRSTEIVRQMLRDARRQLEAQLAEVDGSLPRGRPEPAPEFQVGSVSGRAI